MRLLLLTLPLLLVAFSADAVPTAPSIDEDWPTTDEIFRENVTRTIVHEVTEPTVSGTDIPETTEADVEYESDENRLAEAKKVVEELEKELENARREVTSESDKLAAAYKRLEELQAELDHTVHVVRTLDTAAGITSTVPPTFAADSNTTVATTARQCTAREFDVCREESDAEMGTCMDTCYEHIESFGNDTEEYSKCFTDNNATILAAEQCLFKNKSDFCTYEKEEKTIDITNWDNLTSISYSPAADNDNNIIWEKHEPQYTKLQNFFHCTKNCMHKNLDSCTSIKGCALTMPNKNDFEDKMKQCTKKNQKIANAIFSTCYCLAWQNQVEELQGSCVYIGNQYYVDRA